MQSRLDPRGRDVRVGPVVLRTPGLAGEASVRDPATGGTRGSEVGTKGLAEAMAQTGAREQFTLELTGLVTRTSTGGGQGRGGGPGGAPDQIEVEVPAPAIDEAQVMLHIAEDGVASWHFPVASGAGGSPHRGGPATVTYVLPATLVPVEGGPSAQSRGVGSTVVSKLLTFVVFPLLNPLLKKAGTHFATEFERERRFERWRTFTPDNYRTDDAPSVREGEWGRLSEGPSLLFLHGTGAMAHTAFAGLDRAHVEKLSRRYEGRVFALDHHSLSVPPSTNVARAARDIPPDLDFEVDVVAHSRGGLVARELAERATAGKISPRFRVRSVVMVGTPNAGTALAERANIKAWLDTITNIALLVPDNPVSDMIAVALTVAKHLAIGVFEGLDGVTSMDPAGEYLKALNVDTTVPTRYFAIAADYEPADGTALKRVHDFAIDTLFSGSSNDLVVPTRGVATIPSLARFAPESLVIDSAHGVDHSSFFSTKAVAEKLVTWLPG